MRRECNLRTNHTYPLSTAAVADKPAATPSLQSMDGGRQTSTGGNGGGVGTGDAGYSRPARYVGVIDTTELVHAKVAMCGAHYLGDKLLFFAVWCYTSRSGFVASSPRWLGATPHSGSVPDSPPPGFAELFLLVSKRRAYATVVGRGAMIVGPGIELCRENERCAGHIMFAGKN